MERSSACELVSCIKGHDASKRYAHFDPRVSLDDMAEFVTDPIRVARHGFYPFIQYEKTIKKYARLGDGTSRKEVREKSRKIAYASHRDRCIYQYYAHLLGEKYESVIAEDRINECVLAYRKLGKSNIHFAKESYDYIKACGRCFVVVADFKSFFDTIDHSHLKKMIRLLFEDGRIPDDYYAVLKSLTKYSYCTLSDVLRSKGFPDSRHGVKKLNSLPRIYEKGEMLANKSIFHKNEEGGGIPQGSPMSGLLANIFMVEFDRAMLKAAAKDGGIYRRYSDDVLMTASSEKAMRELVETFRRCVGQTPGLSVEMDKTKAYLFKDGRCYRLVDGPSCSRLWTPGNLTYLGFSFDGAKVWVRERTTARYHGRMRRSARAAFRLTFPKRRKANVERFYLGYSPKGDRPHGDADTSCRKRKLHRNYHSYLRRAKDVFGDSLLDRSQSHYYRLIRRYRKGRR